MKNHKRQILLVEDIPMNVEVASIMLERAGYHYDVAMSGRAALKKIKEKKYDLILMDIQMPEMDGKAVTEKMREAGITTPIIALTANIMSHEVEEFKQSGMNGHLPKPLLYSDLVTTLDNWIS